MTIFKQHLKFHLFVTHYNFLKRFYLNSVLQNECYHVNLNVVRT